MKRSAWIVAALSALVLAGCAHKLSGRDLPTFEERTRPQVTVVDGRIRAPFVLYFFQGEREVTITWTLPSDSIYRFPKNGIEFEGELIENVIRADGKSALPLDARQKEIECAPQNGGLTFTCKNHNTRAGIYKYTIRVVDERGKVLTRDPYVMNDA